MGSITFSSLLLSHQVPLRSINICDTSFLFIQTTFSELCCFPAKPSCFFLPLFVAFSQRSTHKKYALTTLTCNRMRNNSVSSKHLRWKVTLRAENVPLNTHSEHHSTHIKLNHQEENWILTFISFSTEIHIDFLVKLNFIKILLVLFAAPSSSDHQLVRWSLQYHLKTVTPVNIESWDRCQDSAGT